MEIIDNRILPYTTVCIFETGTTLAPKDISATLKIVPLPTIKQALSRLVELQLIKRIGMGRATRYQKV